MMMPRMSLRGGEPSLNYSREALLTIPRYYASAVLDHVHRSKALAEWRKVLHGERVSLERALGAFDMFVLHDQYGDLEEV